MGQSIIPIRNFNRGGIADSKYSGPQDSVAMMVGLNVHDEPGVAKVNQKLTKISGSTITELPGASVATSKGLIYHFSSESGKIWQDNNGTFSLVYTTVPRSGEAKCLSAIEYEGYLYWATQNYVHRISTRKLSDWNANAELNFFEMNIDQEVSGGSGAQYTVPAAISESATNQVAFTPIEEDIIGFSVYIDTVGSANMVLTLHTAANSVVQTVTINHANLTTGWNTFLLSTTWNPEPNTQYHVHITQTGTGAKLTSLVADDLTSGWFKILTNASSLYHPMLIQNNVLYIGDRQYVHQIETRRGVTQADNFALDLPRPYQITDIGPFETELVIGTFISNDVNEARVFRWNTWSVSFSGTYGVKEVGIRAFMQAHEILFAFAGLSGKLYYYDGSKLKPVKQLPGQYDPDNTIDIKPNAMAMFKGVPLFGVSKLSGNATLQGVWSFGSSRDYYPRILNVEYPISHQVGGASVLADVTIGSLLVVGNYIYVAWKYDNGVDAAVCGVDKLDYTAKLSGAYIESLIITQNRHLINSFKKITVNYVNHPGGDAIKIFYKKNYAEEWEEIVEEKVNDIDRMLTETNLDIESSPYQVRIELWPSGNNGPIIESIYVEVE